MPPSPSSNSVRSPRYAVSATPIPDTSDRSTEDQQVHALWTRIAQPTVRTPEIDNNVEVNSSLYPCAKNRFQISVKKHDETKPIHGHRWTMTHSGPCAASRITEHSYSAAQSPEKNCSDQLIDALDSGQGIFEFVSPKAMRGGRSKFGPSIVQMVDQLISANQSGNLCLGGRYEILGFDISEKCHPADDVVHYRLIARDIKLGIECVVPVTQVGLRFDGRALQKKEILRANHALESHKQLVGELRQSEADQGSSADANVAVRHGPLIVSHAGIGRNAALITFSDIRTRILEDRSVDRDNLDQILLEVIATGRQARGPRFFHTKEQLKVVRQMLLELIEEVKIGDARKSVDRLASTDQASRHRLMRTVDLSDLRDRDHQPALPTERQTAPAEDAAVTEVSDFNEVRAIDAHLQPQVGASAPSNVIHPAPNIVRFTDELLTQPSQAMSEPIAARATATTVALSSETATASQPISASGVNPALHSRERLTRQSLQELAPYPLIDEHDPLGRRTIWPLENDQFNTRAIGTNLNFRREPGDCSSGTHFVKGVSGVNEGCWWRAVWLSALLQHAYSSRDEKALEESIVGDLGEHFRPDARVVTEMIHAIRKHGYFSIVLQDTGGRDVDDEYMRLCELGLARHEMHTNATVEDKLKKLANALLEAGGCDEHARYPLLANQPGGDELMPTLCHHLQADLVLFVDLCDVEETAQPYLHVLAQEASPLNYLDVDASMPDPLTDALMSRLAQVPVITAQGSHFDVAIPRIFKPGNLGRPPGRN